MTNESVAFANVLCYYADTIIVGASTNLEGNFELRGIDQDSILLCISCVNFPEKCIHIDNYNEVIVVKLRPCELPPFEYFYVYDGDTIYYNQCDSQNGWQLHAIDGPGIVLCQGEPCNGNLTTCYMSGQIEEMATYKEGHLFTGPYKSYYENGQLHFDGQYKDNHRVGQWVFYNENGMIETIHNYDSVGRKVVGISFLEGGKIESYEWWSGYDSICNYGWLWFHEDGPLEEYLSFPVYGKKSGSFTEFHPNGAIKLCGQMKDGNYDGTFQYFNNEGSIIRKEYYKVGKAILTEIYENGELISTSKL